MWPENWPAFSVFVRVRTQWRTGPRGVIGLDYGVIYRELDRMHLGPDRYDQLMDDLRVLEAAALEEIYKAD